MKYDELFSSPETVLQQRLNELPGDEALTMKQAGYNSVWKTFLEEYFDQGWDTTVKRASLLQKTASVDPFIQGQNEAIDTICELGSDPYARGWFSFIKEAYDTQPSSEDIEKLIDDSIDDDLFDDLEKVGFLEAAQNVLESDHDLVEIAWNGIEIMNSFELGKEAALEDICDFVDSGASVEECLSVINDTVNSELDKNASEEDVDFRLGVESYCYDFLKEAAETYAVYDLEGAHDYDILEHIIHKTAAEDKKQGLSAGEKAAIGAGGLAALGTAAAGTYGAYRGAKKLKQKYKERKKQKEENK